MLAIDTDLMLTGVQQALTRAASIEIVAEARDVATALTAAKEQAANVVLLSCPLGGEPAAALAAQVQATGLTSCLLVLAAPDDEACLRAMLASEVTGYVVHTELGRALVTAIRTLARGQPYFSPEIRLRLVEWAAQAVAAPSELDRLSLTERDRQF